MSEDMGGCRVCGKTPKVYAVVRWADLGLWCSTECWIESEKRAKEKDDANREFLRTGVRYIDPTGK